MRYANIPWLKLLAASPVLTCSSAFAEWTVNLSPGVTDISREVYGLHMYIFWVCVVIGIIVFGVMFYSMYAHRKSKGAEPAQFHESTTVEIIWTVIPFVILIAMAVPATQTLIDVYDSSESDIDIKVTGHQWKWHYDYMDAGFGYFSNLSSTQEQIYNQVDKGEHYLLEVDNPLVIPTGKKVRFLITAADVIHAWWVPALAVKQDAIPGFVNEAWTIVAEPGIYRGQCAELCGKDHGFMPIVVEVKSQEDYAAWLAERQEAAQRERELKDKVWTKDELMARGESTYATFCASCHQADGSGTPPVFPALKGSKMAIEDKPGHIDIVLNGKPGTAMAAYGATLSEVDLAAVITYERNAWGNDTGDVIQPLEIAEIKAAQ